MQGNIIHIKKGRDIRLSYDQKLIQIHKVREGVNFVANQQAMKTLSANGYLLYMYLLLHNDKRIWALSSKDVFNKTALTVNTYPKAVKELIEKGYLVSGVIDTGIDIISRNAYHFYEQPSVDIQQNDSIYVTAEYIDARRKERRKFY